MIIYYLGMLDTNNIYQQQNNGNILYRLYCFTLICLHHHVSSAQWCIYCINYRGFIITFRRNCWYITFHYCYIIVKARYIARCLFGTTNGSSCIMQIPDVCFHTMWNYLFITVHLNDTKATMYIFELKYQVRVCIYVMLNAAIIVLSNEF